MNFRIPLILLIVSMGSLSNAQEETKSLPFEVEAKLIGALFDKQVQGELELVDDQKEQMQQILGSLQKRINEFQRELKDLKDSGTSFSELQSKQKDFATVFQIDKERTMAQAMNVLLPHQQKRLRQAAVQLMMRASAKSSKVATGVLAPEIRDYLKIDDEQAERIKTKATELQKRLAEKIRKLTEQAQSELLSELTQEQKSKFVDLVGDPIIR